LYPFSHLNLRALPWDPHTGEESGDLDAFMKYIISKYCKNIDDKAAQYRKESGFISKVCRVCGYP